MAAPEKLTPLNLLSNEPITSYSDDSLGADRYARLIAATALGTLGPFTIGVYGDWRAGKTTARI